MRGYTGTVALLALVFGLASCGKRGEVNAPQAPLAAQLAGPGEGEPADPPASAPGDPPATPPDGPVCRPPADPANPLAGRGWRFGDDVKSFVEKGPAGLAETCGKCHAVPAPDVIIKAEWPRILLDMRKLRAASGQAADEESMSKIQAYYIENAPVDFARLPAATDAGSLEFRKEGLGRLKRASSNVTNVNVVDIDGDKRPEVLVCDGLLNAVSIVRRGADGWTEEILASCATPVHTAAFDADGDGDRDIVVAVLATVRETDEPVGSVLLLVNNGEKGWERRELATGLPRVTDVEPADIDGDGDPDLVVAAFGGTRNGSINWLRNDAGKWTLVKIADRTGAIHVPVADLDADGHPDFVAITAQESESVTVYVNKGGTFEAKTAFEARNPLFGCSGLQLADLNKDGQLDMLFTNGEALGDPCMMPWPYHGVQWLENHGKLNFEWHEIGRCYGPFGAVAADLDGDGDTDVAVAILFGMWADSGESGLVWYENDGKMNFTRHDIPSPPRLCTLAVGDLDGDGIPELVSGQMNFYGTTGVPGDELLMWSITKKK
ncbi:MAG: FG-GAP-like repeat-containing protein [Planctomycetes bacterium]|nr:FG-GAP-like repeat-containing protein [Planctomycetota bacterium]